MPTLDTIVVEVIERGPQGPQVPDGDKGDITVSSSGTVWNIDAGAVGNTELASDAVTDVKVSASAAIAGTKLANTPAGNIAATTVQAAINELDGDKVSKAADRTALAAIGGATTPAVNLIEAGREGLFRWSSSNLSSAVTADTQQALYVAPASDTSGASGAWVRQWDGINASASWWGVKADNATNDATALQAAVTSAVARLHFPAGTSLWDSTSPITGVSDQEWVGATDGTSTLKLFNSAPSDNFVAFTNKSDIIIRGLTIDWNSKTPTGTHGSLGFQACDRVKVIDCVFPNVETVAIVATGLRDSEIIGNRITKNATDTALNQAILISHSGRTSYGNRVEGNKCSGTAILIASAETSVSNNKVEDFGFGAGVTVEADADTYKVRVEGNIISGGVGTDDNGYKCGGIEIWARDSVVRDNLCFENSGAGIDHGGKNNVVEGNICIDNGKTSPGAPGIVARYQDATYNASGTVYASNRCYDTLAASGTQTYGYEEQSASLTGIVLAESNNFAGNKTGDTSILSSVKGLRHTSATSAILGPGAPNILGISRVMSVGTTAAGDFGGFEILSASTLRGLLYGNNTGVYLEGFNGNPAVLRSGGVEALRATSTAVSTTLPVRGKQVGQLLWSITGANMNTTADQAFTKHGTFTGFTILIAKAVNASAAANSAVGGVYTSTAKGGDVLIAASQGYANLTGDSRVGQTIAAAAYGQGVSTASELYLSLTTPHGSAATVDYYIYGFVVS
jgi:hypothetical protein